MVQFLVGAICVGVTVALHATVTWWVIEQLQKHAPKAAWAGKIGRSGLLSFTAIVLAAKHYIDMSIWASAYWYFAGGEFDSFQSALYFSSVTYTSLGYGDIVLSGDWKLLCGFQAINGILLFGWSSALMFVIVQRMWTTENETKN